MVIPMYRFQECMICVGSGFYCWFVVLVLQCLEWVESPSYLWSMYHEMWSCPELVPVSFLEMVGEADQSDTTMVQ